MKSNKICALLLLASAFLLFACNQAPQKQAVTSPNAEKQAAPVKPEVILYVTGVDKLNLREQPSKEGKVISMIAEGRFLAGSGEVSPNKEEATLRGIPYNEPYIRVAMTISGQQNFWAYGGALIPVYAGPLTGIPDTGLLLKFTDFLKTLNTKKPDSGKQAWSFAESTFGQSSGATADAAFILLEHFLHRMEIEGEFYKLTEKVKWTSEDYEAIADDKFDMAKYPVTQMLKGNGFRLEEGEGMVYPVADWKKLQAFFSSKVTQVAQSYISQHVAEQIEKPWDDGGIIIPLEKLADRAAFWEKFNRENPYFPQNGDAKESERWMRLVLVNGSDNTPTFNYETQTVTEDYKNVWSYILQKYPDTELAKTVKEIADLCAAEGWKRTKKVEDWQTRYAEQY